jgi:hypothetical protein
MIKILFLGLIALTPFSLQAQLLSYDFEGDDKIAANQGTLGAEFDLTGSGSLMGAENNGVGGHGHALDLTGSPEMGGAKGLELLNAKRNAIFPAQKAISVTGWFRTPRGESIDKVVAFIRCSDGYSGPNGSSGFSVGCSPPGCLSLFIGNGGGGLTMRSEKGAFEDEEKWVFFAVTWDGETGNWAWYTGTEKEKIRPVGTGTNPTTMTDGPVSGLRIGRHSSGGGAFKGLLDHIQVYDRALSESEVEKIRTSQLSGQ